MASDAPISLDTLVSTPGSGLDSLVNAANKAITPSPYATPVLVKLKALTSLFVESNEEKYGPGKTDDDDSPGGYYFFARIIESNSPQRLMPDPCDLTTAEDPATAVFWASGHTRVNVTAVGEIPAIKPGTHVRASMNLVNTHLDIKEADFTEILYFGAPQQGNEGCVGGATLTEQFKSQGMVTLAEANGEDASAEALNYYRFPLDINVLENDAAGAFNQFFAALEEQGYGYNINSTRRSVKHQWALYTGKTGNALTPAKPCYSDHQYGYAIDMNPQRPDGTWISSAMSDSEWKPVVDIAKKYNIVWQGSKDRVHFYYNKDSATKDALKKKCINYYYTKYGNSPSSWPDDFADEVAYINTPVSTTTMA